MTFQKIHDLVQVVGLTRAFQGSTPEFGAEWKRRAEKLLQVICVECGVTPEEALKLPCDTAFDPEGPVVREYEDTVRWLYSQHEDFQDLVLV